MKRVLKKIFIDNWQRKILALIIAAITWFFINRSLTITKTIPNIPIRVHNLSMDKTIIGMHPNGILEQYTSITVTGNRNFINKIQPSDIEINIDSKDKTHTFTTTIMKHHLVSKNPNISIERSIKKVKPQDLLINLSKLVKEKIMVLITKPLGEAPKSYQFLDIWPYQLYITLKGPEEVIKNIKAKGIQLTFNLNDISKKELDAIQKTKTKEKGDLINFFIPTTLKKINIPEICPYPLEIDDPSAKVLRIMFMKNDLIPIDVSIPIDLYFPTNTSKKINPEKISIEENNFIKKVDGMYLVTLPLFTQGVSSSFLNLVKHRLHIVVLVEQNEEKEHLDWNIQTIIPIELEKQFIIKTLAEDLDDSIKLMEPNLRENYLKYLFRAYMNTCRLWLSPDVKLKLNISLKGDKIIVSK